MPDPCPQCNKPIVQHAMCCPPEIVPELEDMMQALKMDVASIEADMGLVRGRSPFDPVYGEADAKIRRAYGTVFLDGIEKFYSARKPPVEVIGKVNAPLSSSVDEDGE